MINDLNLEIKGFGPINEANIQINKINVVGGINSSGKSTVGRLLYCFLKANYLSQEENVKKVIMDELNIEVEEKDKNDYLNNLRNILELFKSYDEGTVSQRILKELFYKESLIGFGGYSKFNAPSFSSIVQSNGIISDINIRNLLNNSEKGLTFDEVDSILINRRKGSLNSTSNIFYIDSFSILNIFNYMNSKTNDLKIKDFKNNGFIGLNDHISQLITEIFDVVAVESVFYDPIFSSTINKINDILDGFFLPDYIVKDFKFHVDDLEFTTNNTSSGIKQIGIIQLLLQKEKLKPGSFLIIDEPEVNLHPEWQFNFAQVLVLLAKDLDITLYINSHSPSFIESIDAFTEYYDMQEDINYYLVEESEMEGKYDFNKIESNELYRIYTNLGNVYKLVDKLRIKKRLNR